jgi:hypothetical protein
MQEAAGQIEAGGGQRLTRLPLEDGISVVESRIGRIHWMTRRPFMGQWRVVSAHLLR